jgi:uncharacterized ferritin-like protein (DUF455 family)
VDPSGDPSSAFWSAREACAILSAMQPATVRELCFQILTQGELDPKLTSPLVSGPDGGPLPDVDPGPAHVFERPARAPALELRDGVERLPRPGTLADPRARASCLRRFAHHELMAVELFAWALLVWPAADPALRRGWCHALADEQRHCRMYLARLAAHGEALGDAPLSGYFWKHVAAIRTHPRGPAAFLAAIGLTLEQANLDFTLVYASAFRRGGDEASARVAEIVHADEQRHVRLAAEWLARLSPGESDVDAYRAAVPFPFEAARAKGRAFDAGARRAAGLSEEWIEHVRTARPGQNERAPGSDTDQ